MMQLDDVRFRVFCVFRPRVFRMFLCFCVAFVFFFLVFCWFPGVLAC
jgi:hypothetical protein